MERLSPNSLVQPLPREPAERIVELGDELFPIFGGEGHEGSAHDDELNLQVLPVRG